MKYLVLILLVLIVTTNIVAAQKNNADISTIEINTLSVSITDEEKGFLKEKKSIKMCVDPDWMPMERIHQGQHDGIAADFIKIIENHVGIPIQLVITESWAQSIEFAKARKCDIFSLAMPTAERLKYMSFTSPYLQLPLVLATRKEASYFSEVSLITDEKLGIVAGYAFAEILRNRYPDMRILEVANLREGLVKVENGELFGVIGTLASIGYLVQRGYPELKISGKFNEYWDLGIGVRNDMPLLLTSLEKAVLKIDKKTAQSILNEWISVKYDKGFDYTALLQVSIVFLLIFALFVYRQQLLKKYNQNLEIEILERTKDLKVAKENAELANREKSRFLANMSHELRTPMHAIHSFTKLALKREIDPKARHFLENIDSSTDRLTHLLNDLLDLSKLESGKMVADFKQQDLNHVVLTSIKSLQSLIYDKKQKIQLSIEDKQTGEFDKKLILQVINNLLSNAIKFTPANGTILIETHSVEMDGYSFMQFSITDEGIGIPDDEAATVFDAFVQSTKTMTKAGGTGLGLSISKQIIDVHNGIIWFEKPLHHSGAIFKFLIPSKHEASNEKGIDRYIQHHLQWVFMIETISLDVDQDSSIPEALVKNHSMCELGIWLESDEAKLLFDEADYEALIEHHELFHLLAADLINMKSNDYRIAEKLEKFKAESQMVISMLNKTAPVSRLG